MTLHYEPLGVDFSRALAEGLLERLDGQPPEAMARVTVLVNTARMGRRLEQLLSERGAAFRPRIAMVSDVAPLIPTVPLPWAESALATRLRLMRLVLKLIDADPSLAPRAAAFEMAGGLADLMDEMLEEGVDAAALEDLVATEHAAHWERALRFLRLVARLEEETGPCTAARRQRLALDALTEAWAAAPPEDMVIVAGSTASRAPTRRLMEAVLALPHGHVVLPGVDIDLLRDEPALLRGQAEDHPQTRHHLLLDALGRGADTLRRWSTLSPAVPERTRLASLALRPPPVTDAWTTEGPKLAETLPAALSGVTLLEADGPGEEAEVVAARLRGAVHEGRRSALITPDRTLSRQVAAHLERWGIVPDDSAGRPLELSPPGRLMLQAARLRGRRLEAAGLVALLKHPLAHSAGPRAEHLRRTRRIETRLLRGGMPFPTAPALRAWARENDEDDAWSDWLANLVSRLADDARDLPLADHAYEHIDLMQVLAGGADEDARAKRPTGRLWDEAAGRQARTLLTGLFNDAGAMGARDIALSAADYARLVTDLLASEQVRDPDGAHPDVMIWGALESRVQGAELVILGGLNEGTWPALPGADPWLNRPMRAACGLRAPERTVGLSAHDFQQALGGPEIWLSRATRDAEAEAVPSRWLNRLTNLLAGMGEPGTAALAAMRARAVPWRAAARRLATPDDRHDRPRAPRPAPAPPASARPRELSVTRVETLIRDPYAIYASKVLGLHPLKPLSREPDAPMRGTVVHRAMQLFAEAVPGPLGDDARDRLLEAMRAALDAEVPWPATRTLWLGRLDRIADDVLAAEAARRVHRRPALTEHEGRLDLPGGFTLTARADRIDLPDPDGPDPNGPVALYDYKTGSPPSAKEMAVFSKQLALMALMLEEGAFPRVGRRTVGEMAYLGLGAKYEARPGPLDLIADARANLVRLLEAFADPDKGYAARRANKMQAWGSDYDRLSRHGEWSEIAEPLTMKVGR